MLRAGGAGHEPQRERGAHMTQSRQITESQRKTTESRGKRKQNQTTPQTIITGELRIENEGQLLMWFGNHEVGNFNYKAGKCVQDGKRTGYGRCWDCRIIEGERPQSA